MAKKYKCPFCEYRYDRKSLVAHIEKEHEDFIEMKRMSANQMVYDIVNGTIGYGTCRVCKGKTSWNEKAGRYNVLCPKASCKEYMRDQYKKNMVAKFGTYNILNDEEQQKKMLANRSISGEYTFTDGGKLTYTGSYEKKCLEFMDKVMQIPSQDIMAPGPTIQYKYNGKTHFYITDFMYIPYNLIIEVKDGGSNPNNKNSKSMVSSRERTIEKERIITNQGTYNYIRLTDNQFVQLIEVFMDIKKALIEGNDKKTIEINESAIIQESFIGDKNYIISHLDSTDKRRYISFRKDNSDENLISTIIYPDKSGFMELYRDSKKKDIINIYIGFDIPRTDKIAVLINNLLANTRFNEFGSTYRFPMYNGLSDPYDEELLAFGFKRYSDGYYMAIKNLANIKNSDKYKLCELYGMLKDNYKLVYRPFPKIKSVEEFMSKREGSNIDFANYEYYYLNKLYPNNVSSYCSILCTIPVRIHCYTIVKIGSKFYYIESCLGNSYDGVYESDKIDTLIFNVNNRLRLISHNRTDSIYVCKYKYSDRIAKLTNGEFMDYVHQFMIKTKTIPGKVVKIV